MVLSTMVARFAMIAAVALTAVTSSTAFARDTTGAANVGLGLAAPSAFVDDIGSANVSLDTAMPYTPTLFVGQLQNICSGIECGVLNVDSEGDAWTSGLPLNINQITFDSDSVHEFNVDEPSFAEYASANGELSYVVYDRNGAIIDVGETSPQVDGPIKGHTIKFVLDNGVR